METNGSLETIDLSKDATNPELVEYCLNYLETGVDEGSEFAERNKALSQIPKEHRVPVLLDQGYNMLILRNTETNEIIGHTVYEKHDGSDQEHEPGLHGLRFEVNEDYRDRGFCSTLIEHFIDYGRTQEEVDQVRVSSGYLRGFVKKFQAREAELDITANPETCWISLYPSQE
tara:strand:- start:472 stop:990 length:519 start_codon:yes stop_codon:yes gene_type:complete